MQEIPHTKHDHDKKDNKYRRFYSYVYQKTTNDAHRHNIHKQIYKEDGSPALEQSLTNVNTLYIFRSARPHRMYHLCCDVRQQNDLPVPSIPLGATQGLLRDSGSLDTRHRFRCRVLYCQTRFLTLSPLKKIRLLKLYSAAIYEFL